MVALVGGQLVVVDRGLVEHAAGQAVAQRRVAGAGRVPLLAELLQAPVRVDPGRGRAEHAPRSVVVDGVQRVGLLVVDEGDRLAVGRGSQHAQALQVADRVDERAAVLDAAEVDRDALVAGADPHDSLDQPPDGGLAALAVERGEHQAQQHVVEAPERPR
jgi:hypothetical protein